MAQRPLSGRCVGRHLFLMPDHSTPPAPAAAGDPPPAAAAVAGSGATVETLAAELDATRAQLRATEHHAAELEDQLHQLKALERPDQAQKKSWMSGGTFFHGVAAVLLACLLSTPTLAGTYLRPFSTFTVWAANVVTGESVLLYQGPDYYQARNIFDLYAPWGFVSMSMDDRIVCEE